VYRVRGIRVTTWEGRVRCGHRAGPRAALPAGGRGNRRRERGFRRRGGTPSSVVCWSLPSGEALPGCREQGRPRPGRFKCRTSLVRLRGTEPG
jgi:hypothetical protein